MSQWRVRDDTGTITGDTNSIMYKNDSRWYDTIAKDSYVQASPVWQTNTASAGR